MATQQETKNNELTEEELLDAVLDMLDSPKNHTPRVPIKKIDLKLVQSSVRNSPDISSYISRIYSPRWKAKCDTCGDCTTDQNGSTCYFCDKTRCKDCDKTDYIGDFCACYNTCCVSCKRDAEVIPYRYGETDVVKLCGSCADYYKHDIKKYTWVD